MSKKQTMSNEETTSQIQISTNAPNDLFNNIIFWQVYTDGQNWNRFNVIMKEAKNILAERGSVCIDLKPYNSDCDDAFLSLLLNTATHYAFALIDQDETMRDVEVIYEPIETYNSNLRKKSFMLCLYLEKNEYIIN